jgi:proteasome lid subunit RPN8/RPN11
MRCKDFHIKIDREVYEKMLAYVDECPTEISGFGTIEMQPNGIRVTDAFLIDQEVTSASTDMDTEAIYAAVNEATLKGEDTSTWGCWWHSHANMQVFFSQTDLKTIDILRSSTPLVSIVFNKRREYSCQVNLYEPLELCLTEVPLEIVYTASEKIKEEARKEIETKVHQRIFVPDPSKPLVRYNEDWRKFWDETH